MTASSRRPRLLAGVAPRSARGIDSSQILQELVRRPVASLRVLLEGLVDDRRQERGQGRVQRQRRREAADSGADRTPPPACRPRTALSRSPSRKGRLPARRGPCAGRASFRAPVRETCSRPCQTSSPSWNPLPPSSPPPGPDVEAGVRSFANPKSRILTRSSSVIMTLPGFRSRCRIPAA